MKPTALLTVLLTGLGATLALHAQSPVPPPAPPGETVAPAALDSWLAPVALYPDPLLAQVLAAATQPSDIVLADRYLSGGGDPNHLDEQPWAPSVKALARYPGVLKMMDDYLPWTTALGEAFVTQEPEVMGEIQRLRAEAVNLGNLESTPEESILNEEGAIEILPTQADVLYVPQYDSDIIYEQQLGAGCIGFSPAYPMGLWMDRDFDWSQRQLLVWDHIYPRPADWWSSRAPLPPAAAPPRHPDDGTRDPRTRPSHFVIWQVPQVQVVHADSPASRGWPCSPVQRHHLEHLEPPKASNPSVIVLPNRGVMAAAHGGSSPGAFHLASTPSPVQVVPVPTTLEPDDALIGVESAHDAERFSHRGHESREDGRHGSHPSHHAGESHPASPPHSSSPGHSSGGSGRH